MAISFLPTKGSGKSSLSCQDCCKLATLAARLWPHFLLEDFGAYLAFGSGETGGPGVEGSWKCMKIVVNLLGNGIQFIIPYLEKRHLPFYPSLCSPGDAPFVTRSFVEAAFAPGGFLTLRKSPQTA